MELAHSVLAYAAVAFALLGLAWSVLLATGRVSNRLNFERFTNGAIGLVLAAALVGVVQLASGARPNEDLHLIYGVIAVGLIPLARSFAGGNRFRNSWILAAAYVVLVGVVFRLFMTG